MPLQRYLDAAGAMSQPSYRAAFGEDHIVTGTKVPGLCAGCLERFGEIVVPRA